ncbi:hypothetical protein MXL46_20305 [Heyndrickxia sporothermodurans]|uniref:hypothetical protein n=1 Tax=Heyndrickxia sporothermodurans TaxID=46224 RepID=UPI002DBDD707|nr:hypothetical protein [Heyndrickxia sporothermodurans]MEB6551359.1 hypothetical protein [Heyndrickxia sporothermodurans]
MKIKVLKSNYDEKGIGLPPEMIGKKYDVIKKDKNGVWVENGKLEVLVNFEELQIIDICHDFLNVLDNYLKNVQNINLHKR